MFLGELNRLSFSSPGAATFTVVHAGVVIFENTYYPDEDGMITVHELADVLEPYIQEIFADFSFEIAGASAGTVRVFYCSWSMAARAMTFLDSSFLSPMTGIRRTHTSRYETLSLYCNYSEAVTVECRYFDGGAIGTKTVSLGGAQGARMLNVSSARFLDPSRGTLVGYTVKCGQRRAEYMVLPYMPDLSDAFIFRNSFNAWETLYLVGSRETDPQYSRSTANVNGYIRSYQIEEVISMTTYTGPLPDGMEWITMALARSKAVFLLLENGDSGDEIHITDCDLKHTNDQTSEADLNFSYRNAAVKWRMADDRAARLSVPRPPRIFDDTFDETYE